MIFSIIIVGWSFAGVAAEDAAWSGLENRIVSAREQWKRAGYDGGEWELRFWREEVERLEVLAESRGSNTD